MARMPLVRHPWCMAFASQETLGEVYITIRYGGYVKSSQEKIFLCLDNEHIFGGDQGYTPEIMGEILTTARDLKLEVNENDIEELIMGHEDELTTEELPRNFE
ncbi:hypothetical protein TNCV_4521801 [Trichonephila clavipes]|nr:hypothetical protein TNCV_4521801 [Trichonephila clavipes]